jgi:hypothetical protein
MLSKSELTHFPFLNVKRRENGMEFPDLNISI